MVNSVNKAIKPLNKVRNNLSKVVEVRRKEAKKKQDESDRLKSLAELDAIESERANKLLEKFDELLS